MELARLLGRSFIVALLLSILINSFIFFFFVAPGMLLVGFLVSFLVYFLAGVFKKGSKK